MLVCKRTYQEVPFSLASVKNLYCAVLLGEAGATSREINAESLLNASFLGMRSRADHKQRENKYCSIPL